MRTSFVIYETATGRIIATGTASAPSYASAGPGRAALFGDAPPPALARESWVENGAIVPRPRLRAPESALRAGDALALGEIPEGSELRLDGASLGLADGSAVEILFETDGVFRLEVSPPWPWIGFDVLLEVAE